MITETPLTELDQELITECKAQRGFIADIRRLRVHVLP